MQFRCFFYAKKFIKNENKVKGFFFFSLLINIELFCRWTDMPKGEKKDEEKTKTTMDRYTDGSGHADQYNG